MSDGYDLTLIEAMPLGETGMDRMAAHLPLVELRDRLATQFALTRLADRTGGPARYFHVGETGGRLGFITPLSHNFCEGCNRVRLTSTGKLYLCLGQDDHVDLRSALREDGLAGVNAALDRAMILKPKGHDFDIRPRRHERRSRPAYVGHGGIEHFQVKWIPVHRPEMRQNKDLGALQCFREILKSSRICPQRQKRRGFGPGHAPSEHSSPGVRT